jgi:hypothetical protein
VENERGSTHTSWCTGDAYLAISDSIWLRNTSVGRIIVNNPKADHAGDARVSRPNYTYRPTGIRYWNLSNAAALCGWETLNVRWALSSPRVPDVDEPEDKP